MSKALEISEKMDVVLDKTPIFIVEEDGTETEVIVDETKQSKESKAANKARAKLQKKEKDSGRKAKVMAQVKKKGDKYRIAWNDVKGEYYVQKKPTKKPKKRKKNS